MEAGRRGAGGRPWGSQAENESWGGGSGAALESRLHNEPHGSGLLFPLLCLPVCTPVFFSTFPLLATSADFLCPLVFSKAPWLPSPHSTSLIPAPSSIHVSSCFPRCLPQVGLSSPFTSPLSHPSLFSFCKVSPLFSSWLLLPPSYIFWLPFSVWAPAASPHSLSPLACIGVPVLYTVRPSSRYLTSLHLALLIC